MRRDKEYEVTYIITIKARRTIYAPNEEEMWNLADDMRDYIEIEDRDAIDDVEIIGVDEL